MKLPDLLNEKTAYNFLRVAMGIIFITHGVARLYYGSVSDFGGFLNTQGLVIGLPLAWIITIGEIICGSLLAFGYFVQLCVIFPALVIISGLFLVHFSEGWFVVGHGTGGVEYSLLILAVSTFIYSRRNSIASLI